MGIKIYIADSQHEQFAEEICDMINEASQKRGTGIAKRSPVYIAQKLSKSRAIIAFDKDKVVGFCYLETWGHDKYVANSGLIVHEDYRGSGLAGNIKTKAFELSRKKFPEAKLFGITTSLPVMRINSDLGYKPVTFSELTDDQAFWDGCKGCRNHDILERNNHKMCLCTGMLFDPAKELPKQERESKSQRWTNFKRFLKLRKIRTKRLFQSLKNISLL